MKTFKPLKTLILALLIVISGGSTLKAQYVIDFRWEETEIVDGFSPAITLVVGEKHKLKYSYSSNTLGNIFAQENRDCWVFYDFTPSQHIVDESDAIFSLDEEGNVTGIKAGFGALKPTGCILKAEGTNMCYIKVISCRSEKEDNNTIATANEYISPIEFMLNSKYDVDYFEIQLPNNDDEIENFDIILESQIDCNLLGHQITVYNEAGETFGVGNANGTSFSQSRWGWAGTKMYVAISWRQEPAFSDYWQYNHKVKLTIQLSTDSDGINSTQSDEDNIVNVYDINGILIRNSVESETSLVGLPKGFYIVKGKKVRKVSIK